ncbi:SDR family NAD(P)-dependent oxidoreductase [Streptomyces mirabilis]|uniref:SDR family NAD(P)-dependent oxidoreductase n=1 Tax=Streptomyces mirabilis TaxID=68239 RepID=UPI0036760EBF
MTGRSEVAARTAVVSGGTRGIGLELSRRLSALGYHVLALYRGDERAARAAAGQRGDGIEAVRIDLTRPAEVRAGCERILAAHGAPHVLVNNAGVNRDRPFLELTDEDWDQVIATNLSGPFHLTRALAPAMVAAGRGSIVNIGATTAIRPRPNGANYCASKAGLLQLTRCLALELAPAVRVNALIPGFTDTPEVVERYRLDEAEPRRRVLGQIPLGRIGTVTDVADALEFLVTDRSSYLTGQQLVVDGGNFMG